MADNVTANPGVGGPTIRTKNIGGVNTEIVQFDIGGESAEVLVSASNPMPVTLPSATVATLTPPGAITNYANETGGNLAAIATNTGHIPALGQALAAGSTPVVLPAAQVTALTPPAAITNYANESGGNLDAIHTFLATLAGAVSSGKVITDGQAESPTGGAVPADAEYLGVNVGGNLIGQTGKSVGSAVAAHVAVVDASGNQIINFGGTQYVEGTVVQTPSGIALFGQTPTNTMQVANLDVTGNLLVTTQQVLQTTPAADGTISADASQTYWHEGEGSKPIREQFVYDTNTANVLGTQSLLDPINRRLMVSDQPAPEQQYSFHLNGANQEARVNLTGVATVVVSVSGTWSGALQFYVTSDGGQNWYIIYGESINASVEATSLSNNGMWRARVAGMTGFRVFVNSYASGVINVQITTSPLLHTTNSQFAVGSQTQAVQQKPTSYELYTYDTSTAPSAGQVQNALLNLDPWTTRGVYYAGDTVLYQGQVYQCIFGTATITPPPAPTNTTYWQVDQRQQKSLVAQSRVSPGNASRLRVEQEGSLYIQGIEEQLLLTMQLMLQNDLIYFGNGNALPLLSFDEIH